MLTVAIVGAVILFVTALAIQCVTVVNEAREARRELDEQIRMLSLVASSVTHTSARRARNILARARPMGRILEGVKDDAVPRKKRPRAPKPKVKNGCAAILRSAPTAQTSRLNDPSPNSTGTRA
jgi:hypothetical protein